MGKIRTSVSCPEIQLLAGCLHPMEPATPGDEESQLPNPADAFFKEAFSHLETAASFFQHYLPPEIAAHADWKTLQREPESYLDARLRSKFADLLFSVSFDGKSGFFYILLEHKSVPERWTVFYLLELMVRIWRKHLDNGKFAGGRLPVIIPLVFHQGPKGWSHSVQFREYFDSFEGNGRFIPAFEHLLVDLSRLPWEQIKGEARVQLAMTIMKAARENTLLEVLPRVAPMIAELGSGGSVAHFIEALARYMIFPAHWDPKLRIPRGQVVAAASIVSPKY